MNAAIEYRRLRRAEGNADCRSPLKFSFVTDFLINMQSVELGIRCSFTN